VQLFVSFIKNKLISFRSKGKAQESPEEPAAKRIKRQSPRKGKKDDGGK
jgi:hypothetical protein